MLDEIAHFVNWIRRRNPEAHTWRDYRCDLQQFVASCGRPVTGSHNLSRCRHFCYRPGRQGFNPATINRRLAAIISFYTFLADELPDLVCPVLPHRHWLRQRHRLPRPVPAADLTSLFCRHTDGRDRAIFLLMLRCGLRISEVAGLKLRDLIWMKRHPACWSWVRIARSASFTCRHRLSKQYGPTGTNGRPAPATSFS
jgi:site-specific recombinase XerC